MKIRIAKESLVKLNNKVGKAITGKSTLPLLQGVYLDASNGVIKVQGYDGDVAIIASENEVVIEKEGNLVILDAKMFFNIAKVMPSGEVTIETIENDRLAISSGEVYFTLCTQDSTEYPVDACGNTEGDMSIEIPSETLHKMINNVAYASANDEVRPALKGICISGDEEGITTVALDGYRMSKRFEEDCVVDNKFEVLVDSKTIVDVMRAVDSPIVELKISENYLTIQDNSTKVKVRLLSDKFVDYKKLMQTDSKITLVVEKEKLRSSLDRAFLITEEKNTRMVKLNIKDKSIGLEANSTVGRISDKIAAKEVIYTEGNINELNIAFNTKYLLDAIKHIESNEVTIKMTSHVSPCIIEGNTGEVNLVLPVRLVK